MIEVELKAGLSLEAERRLRGKVQAMEFQGIVPCWDVYYDTGGLDLLQNAVFVRVRDNSQLQFKFNESADPAHVQSLERVFRLVPDQAQAEEMNALFARFLPFWHAAPDFETARVTNRLIELAHIRNRREVYTGNGIHLSIDHVEGLGDFLEVEVQCEERAEAEKAVAVLQAFLAELDVQPLSVGYVELWLRVHNPQAYQLGRYHL